MKKKTILCLVTIIFLTLVAFGVKAWVDSEPFEKAEPTTTRQPQTTTTTTKPETTETQTTTTANTTTTTQQQPTETQTTIQQTTQTTEKPTTTKQQTTQTTTAKPTTTTTTTQQNKEIVTGFEQEMLNMINAERIKCGKKTLTLDSTLCSLSQTRAKEISTLYRSDHIRPNGTEWSTILDYLSGTSLNDWTCGGENIAYGQTSWKEVTEDWIASPGHYENIIKTEFTHVGFGCCSKDGVLYWEQIFVGM